MKNNLVLVRSARLSDLDRLLEIESASFQSDLLSRQSLRRHILRAPGRLLVAEDATGLLYGYVLLFTRSGSRRGRIYSLAVHPEHRGSGVGVQLLSAVSETALELHLRSISLEVRVENQTAIALYRKFGFEKVGEKPGYYEDGSDAVVMSQTLDKGADIPMVSRSRAPVVLVDDRADLQGHVTNARVLTVSEYLRLSLGVKGRIVVNLARSYEPLSRGYYASLLAAARGEKGFPAAFNLLDINWKRIHARALQEFDPIVEALYSTTAPPESVLFHFGTSDTEELVEFGALLFDRFRCPILLVRLSSEPHPSISDIEALPLHRLSPEDRKRFKKALESFLRQRQPISDTLPRSASSIAILVEPQEAEPPSDAEALQRFRQAALELDARVSFITKKDLTRLTQFDALLIRTTTALDHYTYRFARKAADEGIPVFDSPETILKCTNKVFLYELLRTHGIPTPRTVVFDKKSMTSVAETMTWPAVLKVPDSCYSLGVFRVESAADLARMSNPLFEASDLLLLQAWTPTKFDWRIGILDGKPLFACRYFMAEGHWQIMDHAAQNGVGYGETETIPLDAVPAAVLETAMRAGRAVGDGLLGVDLKETNRGILVIEVNDNPNLDAGIEDAVLGLELYKRVLSALLGRIGKSTTVMI